METGPMKRLAGHEEVNEVLYDVMDNPHPDSVAEFVDKAGAIRVSRHSGPYGDSLPDFVFDTPMAVTQQQRKALGTHIKNANSVAIDRGRSPGEAYGQHFQQTHPQMSDVLKFLGEGN